MGLEAVTRRAHQSELRNALTNDEFVLHYHPIVDVHTREPASVEALIRWKHPQRGMISPLEFIPLAEETGLINPIGEWVLRKACADAAQWPGKRQGQRQSIGSAVSPPVPDRQCPQRPRRNRTVARAARTRDHRNGVAARQRRQRRDAASATRDGHCHRLDDFGTGYSSLSYLRMFPFDKIKIDRSFVHELAKNEHSASIVSAVAGLGRSLRMARSPRVSKPRTSSCSSAPPAARTRKAICSASRVPPPS